jgi:hypothetical protein
MTIKSGRTEAVCVRNGLPKKDEGISRCAWVQFEWSAGRTLMSFAGLIPTVAPVKPL